MEVRPRRAREAFCRWLQQWARFTRDMVDDGLVVRGLGPEAQRGGEGREDGVDGVTGCWGGGCKRW